MTEPGNFEDTELHEAVRYADVDEVKDALRRGCDPNQIGLYQWSPLHEATSNGDISIVRLLLKHEGKPNDRDLLKGCTAVHYAASGGYSQILQLLIDSGGRYDIVNNEGKTSLDVAAGSCIALLKNQCGVMNEDSLEVAENKGTKDKRSEALPITDTPSDQGGQDSSRLDTDNISLLSDSSASSWPSTRAWETASNSNKKNIALGQIQLSFEYNSRNNTLKIRVWQVTNLLFPPADSSMIGSVYVKSYLMPDKRRDSKKKSEEIQVYAKNDVNAKNTMSRNSFTPRTFAFAKALEYKNVTKDLVAYKIVHIEVCVMQKYTRRSYVIATWNSPLSVSVKQLVKKMFPLTPRLSTELPSNMKIYNASSLHAAHVNQGYSSSVPNSRTHSMSSLPTGAERASSDSDLQAVKIEPIQHAPSIEITVPSEDEEESEFTGNLTRVSIVKGSGKKDRSSIAVVMGHSRDDSVGSLSDMIELQELEDVTIDKHCKGSSPQEVKHVSVHIPVDLDSTQCGDSEITRSDADSMENSATHRPKRFSFSRSREKEEIRLQKKSKRKSDKILTEINASNSQSDSSARDKEALTMIPMEFELREFSGSASVDTGSGQLSKETRLEMLPKVHKAIGDTTGEEVGISKSKGKGRGKSSTRFTSAKKTTAIVNEI